ncbi:MAG: DUF5696 domain-containing protein, partial [Bacillota bacterium]
IKKISIFIFIIILLTVSQINAQQIREDMEFIVENNYLKLYINRETTEIGVMDKTSGDIWYSNPEGDNRQDLHKSQFEITYLDEDEEKNKNNYTHSIDHDKFEIKEIDKGVRINYQLVDKWRDEDFIPFLMGEQMMEEDLFPEITEEEKNDILENYHHIELVETDEENELEISGLDTDKIFGEYTLRIPDADISASEREDLVWRLIDVIKDNRGDIENTQEITYEDLNPLRDKTVYLLKEIPPFRLEPLKPFFEKAGFTPQEIGDIHKLFNIDPPVENLEVFKIPLEYKLEGKDFVVNIPVKDVKYPVDAIDTGGVAHTFPITNIDLLRFFGAADSSDEGYMLLPEGSGGLIELNNERVNGSIYTNKIYGKDYTSDEFREKIEYREKIQMPIFGLKKGDSALLGIIEKGDALGNLRTTVAGQNYSYNTISSTFDVMYAQDIQILDGLGLIYVYPDQLYQDDIKIRYSFFSGEDADYSGMARHYREYLFDTYDQLQKISSKENIPFYLELIGAISTQKPVLGVPMETSLPVTNYSEAKKIIETLKEDDINNLKLKYSGWMKGGLNHSFPDAINFEQKVGSESEFNNFKNYLSENEINFYPEVNLSTVKDPGFFSSFKPEEDASFKLDHNPAEIFEYNYVTFQQQEDEFSYILSPSRLDSVFNSFQKDLTEYGVDNIAFRNLGNLLNSDLNEDRVIDRQSAQNIISKQLEQDQQENNFIVNEGFIYTVPFADSVLNSPLTDGGVNLIDHRIPFYQMVLNGYVEYTGPPINFNFDKDTLLRHIEAGAYPYFKWFFREGSLTKNTGFNNLYSGHYHNWLGEARDYYQTLNEVYKGLNNEEIVEHELIEPDVRKTTYSNGDSIIVNYRDEPFEYQGHQIETKSFKRIN